MRQDTKEKGLLKSKPCKLPTKLIYKMILPHGEKGMEKIYKYGNIEVKVIDNCTNPEERRKRLEDAVREFYKEVYWEKKQNEQKRINARNS